MPTPKIIRTVIPGNFDSRRRAAVPGLGKDPLICRDDLTPPVTNVG